MTAIAALQLHYPTKRLHLCQLILTQMRKRTIPIRLLSLIRAITVIAECWILQCFTMF